MVTAVETQASAAAALTKAQEAGNKITSDFNFFLKMLTTQLTNQDPTQPMDVSQMTQQIAQFSGVQQQVQTNSNLEKLLAQQNQSLLSTAVSYIGKEVETKGNTGTLFNKSAAFSYSLPKAAANVEVVITNKSGVAVFKGAGPVAQGRNLVVWDGVNSFTNAQEADGKYTITVKAKDANGAEIAADTRAVGIVNTVETAKDGSIKLTVGDVTIDFNDIVAVRNPTRLAG